MVVYQIKFLLNVKFKRQKTFTEWGAARRKRNCSNTNPFSNVCICYVGRLIYMKKGRERERKMRRRRKGRDEEE